MYLSASDIQKMEPTQTVDSLNPTAIRLDKSLGDVVGLRNLGFHWISIDPGNRSTEYHVHHFEEECIYVLSGRGTAIVGDRTILIGPGDFLGFVAGGPGHELINEGSEPLVCLVVGQRLEFDVTDYPRLHKRLYRHKGEWDLVGFTDLADPDRQIVLPPTVVPSPTAENRMQLVPIGRDGKIVSDAVLPLPRLATEAGAASAELYAAVGYVPPWIGYLGFVAGECVGTCAFKAPPKDNRVEIAYYTFPDFERHGHATSMASALMEIAFNAHPGIRLVAHTRAEENASTAVLTKLGFHLTGRGYDKDDGEVWEWVLQTAAS
ncbi:MAG: GNAT family N-acetyltransferase [Betaproteobacteria bacterium]|nr:GNAT family N-acetyltransferase [Betaproteobacteria bacterium]